MKYRIYQDFNGRWKADKQFDDGQYYPTFHSAETRNDLLSQIKESEKNEKQKRKFQPRYEYFDDI